MISETDTAFIEKYKFSTVSCIMIPRFPPPQPLPLLGNKSPQGPPVLALSRLGGEGCCLEPLPRMISLDEFYESQYQGCPRPRDLRMGGGGEKRRQMYE